MLRGGECGIPAAQYARLTDDLLRPSTRILEGPHVDLFQTFRTIGDQVFDDGVFEQTSYYRNAITCIDLVGHYFESVREPWQIRPFTRNLVYSLFGEEINWTLMPGQSVPGSPIVVRPIAHSNCFEVLDGNHRLAKAAVSGCEFADVLSVECPILTPVQQMLLDVLWQKGRLEVYQPVSAPEVATWHCVRRCSDRLGMMLDFLQSRNSSNAKSPTSFLDVGCSYGWFVASMLKAGFDAYGLERDPLAIRIGSLLYGLPPHRLYRSTAIRYLSGLKPKYDIVSCFSMLHHFALGKEATRPEELVRLLDEVTGSVLFVDTGQNHEEWFAKSLPQWNEGFIAKWLKDNTSFRKVDALGVDSDAVAPYEKNYRRTLFACSR